MRKVTRNNIIWNVMSGSLNSVYSVICLMIITRVLGVYEAGIFTIAYAIANLFLMIGNYGIRTFQVSDIKSFFHWREYYTLRIITIFFMLLSIILYSGYRYAIGDYSIYKSLVVILMTFLKAIDAYEDVYHGMYQQNGRLDIAGMAMSIRLVLQLSFMVVCFLLGLNVLKSLALTNLFSWLCVCVILKICNKRFVFNHETLRFLEVYRLLKLCTPLFLSGILGYYICNAAKYAIDFYRSEEEQAYYGFIVMPIFAIYLFANFIYQPILKDISMLWMKGEKEKFLRQTEMAIGLLVLVSGLVLFIGKYWGIQILGWIYSVDLHYYKTDFGILLLGSALYAFAAFLNVLLTVMRHQMPILFVNMIVVFFCQCITGSLVQNKGIDGACMSYMITMGIQTILYVVLVAFFYLHDRTTDTYGQNKSVGGAGK